MTGVQHSSAANLTGEEGGPDLLTPDRIDHLVQEIAHAAGLDPRDRQLIKFTNNAVIRLPAAEAVVRIAGSATARQRLPAVVAAASWFHVHDIPAVRLWPGLDQPLTVRGHLATIWVEVRDGGPPARPGDLATILRAIHTITGPPPPQIPAWSPTTSIRTRLAEATAQTETAATAGGVAGIGGFDRRTLAFLSAETDALDVDLQALAGMPPLIPPGVIHGDAHLGNLIPGPHGPVICDFDSTRVGPREWDLTPAAVGALRFDPTGTNHRGLAAAYGVDVTTWPGFPILRRLRELQLVTSVLPVLAVNPALRPQWQHRLNTYRVRDQHALWTPYPSG